MPLSGKYDFPGIKKAGALGLKIALASTTWGAWFVKGPITFVTDPIIEFLVNWMANNGLMIFNLGAILVNGELDQHAFDKSLDDGLKAIELGRDKISKEQGKAIDDEVIKAARKFISFNP